MAKGNRPADQCCARPPRFSPLPTRLLTIFTLSLCYSTFVLGQDFEDLSFPPDMGGFAPDSDQPLDPSGSSITQEDLVVGPSASNPSPNRKAVAVAQPKKSPPPKPRVRSARERDLDRDFDKMWDLKFPDEIVESFDFPDSDIQDLIKAISKMTRKNVIMDPKVGGKITIITQVPISVREAFKVFLTALSSNNFTVVRSGDFMRVVRLADAREMNHPVLESNRVSESDTVVTRVLPIRNVNSEDVLRNIRALTNKEARIFNLQQTNTLIIVETASNLQRILRMVELLDREGFIETPELIPIKNTQASELQKLLQTIISGAPANTGQGGAAPRPAPRPATPTNTKSLGPRITNIIADDRTNSLIVLANEQGLERVRDLVSRLDVPADVGAGEIHIYYLTHADAESVQKTLSSLISGSGAGGGGAPAGGGNSPASRRTFGASSGQLALDGRVNVSADKDTNSLVVTAKPTDYETLKGIIEKLDIARDQVFVEALVLEMALNRDFDFSPNVLGVTGDKSFNRAGFITNPGDLASFLLSPQSMSGMVLGNSFLGKTQEVEVPNPGGGSPQKLKLQAVNAMIKALQTVTDANVRATPALMAFDNQESTIQVKERVPVRKTVTTQTGSSSSIENQDVGLEMKIKPRINKASAFVKMDIEFGLDDFASRALASGVTADGGVATTTRKFKTSVSVQDSDTVAFGGLIRDTIAETRRQLPLLGDIPILGWLFKSTERKSTKSNLMVFITPKIIKQYDRTRTILNDKISERDEFIAETKGGKDPYKKTRDQIIGTSSRAAQNGSPNSLLREEPTLEAPALAPEDAGLPSFGE